MLPQCCPNVVLNMLRCCHECVEHPFCQCPQEKSKIQQKYTTVIESSWCLREMMREWWEMMRDEERWWEMIRDDERWWDMMRDDERWWVALLFKGYMFSWTPHDKSLLSFQPLSTFFRNLAFKKTVSLLMLMGWGGVGMGWVGLCVRGGLSLKATCFPENHMTNHCCLSSRYLFFEKLAFDKTISLLMLMGWGKVGMGWVVCEGWLVCSRATCFPENHMTNHCCLSSRYLLLKILAF